VSFEMPEYTGNVDALGTLRILDAIRTCGLTKKVKFYQASTSELYGKAQQIPQTEVTPFYPRSPYAVAKLYAYWAVVNYREAYGMYACNGILFNHESPRRGPTFVTKKTTRAVTRIFMGKQDCLYLGNLDAKRDWGHARDYVYAMWQMLNNSKPATDYVVASGETHSVREFVEKAFACPPISWQLKWEGTGVDEVGYVITKDGDKNIVVRVDKEYFRPTEVDILHGDPSKVEKELGWKRKVTFNELVHEMVTFDLEQARAEANHEQFDRDSATYVP